VAHATIELRDMPLAVDLGHYDPGDVVPDRHLLDLTLHVGLDKVLVGADGMEHVFDYDPLVAQIDALAREGHYETQEWLISRIVAACLTYREIEALEVGLRKGPVRARGGTLGLRVSLDADEVAQRRRADMPQTT
jgi:dihydroneopterin aldolase